MPVTCEVRAEKIYSNYLHEQYSAICVHVLAEECKIIL